jgi:hypothetical protein
MKKLFTKITLMAVFALVAAGPVLGQGVTVSGSIHHLGYVGRTYREIKGSPFLYDHWSLGSVKFHNGTGKEGLSLKYDQIADVLIFTNPGGQEQTFLEPVAEFTLPASPENTQPGVHRFRNGYAPVDGANEASFYEILQDGPTQLLKRTTKKIVEERAPNSNILKVRQVRPNVKYYFATADQLVLIRKDRNSVLAALMNRYPQVEQFLKEQKLNLKEEKDLVRLTQYYNTL